MLVEPFTYTKSIVLQLEVILWQQFQVSSVKAVTKSAFKQVYNS